MKIDNGHRPSFIEVAQLPQVKGIGFTWSENADIAVLGFYLKKMDGNPDYVYYLKRPDLADLIKDLQEAYDALEGPQ